MFSERLRKHLKDVIDNYYDVLSMTGFVKESDSDRIAVLSGLEEMINSPMSVFINDTDYRHIQNAIACVLGSSCMIPHMEGDRYVVGESLSHENTLVRISEDGVVRFSEDGVFRITD